MKIIVCIKVVDGAINPFDECAVEAALSIADSEVTVISMCPPMAKDVILPLTRLGIKKAILISDKAFVGSDTLATSYILSKTLEKLEYDMILCGRQSIDGETAQVGSCLATTLGIPVMTNIMEIKSVGKDVLCRTRMGDESVMLPALLTIERINVLRFPSIRSKLGEVEIWDNSVIGADTSRCGLNGSPTRVLQTFESTKGQRKCKIIQNSELMPLIKSLSKTTKKDFVIEESKSKLKSVWAIGNAVVEYAYGVSENVIVINETDPKKIAKRALEEKPDVILWNADLWGRKNAPIVAAILKTGLCADCTDLETDGKILYMYRPAKGGNIIAKIKCNTLPQMATVRTADTDCSDVIVSGGKGVADNIDRLCKLADVLGAQVCASRGLVDMGRADYEMQVGLTGKTVSPKIYIAIGISGAVHHTVGIENADTVIAINPDKDARIFEYADYGLVSDFENIEF